MNSDNSKLNAGYDQLLFPSLWGDSIRESDIIASRLQVPSPRASLKGNRKKITSVNKRSLDRLVFRVACSGIRFFSLATLSYGQNYPINGKRVKSDLNHFLTDMKRSFGPFSYYWFLEFQTRGAPHLHVVSTLPEPGDCERELMAKIWADIAEDGNWAYTEIKPPYLKKEAR
jgi:hypothetical protein